MTHIAASNFNVPPIERHGGWIQTYSGKAYWPADPHFREVFIEDIAHALSMMCRYAGHCSEFYSVAEHSLIVSHMVPEEHALSALLHDATEAYVVDVPRPVKVMLTNYADLEWHNWVVICQKFGLPFKMDPSIKQADNDILLLEKTRLLGSSPREDWLVGHVPVATALPKDIEITCDPPGVAEMAFLTRFHQLYLKR